MRNAVGRSGAASLRRPPPFMPVRQRRPVFGEKIPLLYQSEKTARSALSAISDRLSYPNFFGTLCLDCPSTSDPVQGRAMRKPGSTPTARPCSSQTVVLRGMPASKPDVLRRRSSEKSVFYGTV
jgi:hypothetical protein